MQHSQSEVVLGTSSSSWANLKEAESMKKRSNTAHNLQFYVEEQKRLYQELPFMVLPGMRRESFQRQRSSSNLRSKLSWGSFTSMAKSGEDEPLVDKVDGQFEEPGYTKPLLWSCIVAMLSAFQFGYHTGVMGAINAEYVFPGHSSFNWSLGVSVFAIGGPFGSLFTGDLSSSFGRKKALLVDAVLFVFAGLIMTFSMNIYMLIIGRFVAGIACGAVTVVVPLYLGELAPPNLRGALGTGYQFAVVMGIFIADTVAFPFSTESHSFTHPGWRLQFAITLIPALGQVLLAPMLFESPRWLLTKNQPKDAADILRRLRGTSDVYEEIDSIVAANDNETSNVTVMEVICDRTIRYPLLVGIGLQMAQQLSGINAVFYYANTFFSTVGLSSPLVGTTLVGAINVVSTAIALILMDRVGRRPLLLWSCVGMALSSLVITLSLGKYLPGAGVLSVGAVCCYVWFFEMGLGPIPWLIVAEMFPAKSRSTAMSIATMVNWVCNFIIGIGFPVMQQMLKNATFIPFAMVLAIGYLGTVRYVPETKGKTLEEIQKNLPH